MNSLQAAFGFDPLQAVPVLSLAAALGANLLLGVAVAIRLGSFSFQQLGRILASQLASTEIRVIVSMLAAALATAFTSGVAINALTGGNRVLLGLLITVTMNTFVAASGLYSLQLWHECVLQLRSLVTGADPPASKQWAGTGMELGPVANQGARAARG